MLENSALTSQAAGAMLLLRIVKKIREMTLCGNKEVLAASQFMAASEAIRPAKRKIGF